MMQRLLTDAGVKAGMRVLDVGCGYGRIARMAAEIVGDDGEVIGVDRDPTVLERAREDAPRTVASSKAICIRTTANRSTRSSGAAFCSTSRTWSKPYVGSSTSLNPAA